MRKHSCQRCASSQQITSAYKEMASAPNMAHHLKLVLSSRLLHDLSATAQEVSPGHPPVAASVQAGGEREQHDQGQSHHREGQADQHTVPSTLVSVRPCTRGWGGGGGGCLVEIGIWVHVAG